MSSRPAATYPRVQFNIWKSFAPRLRAAYDFGDGKTVIKDGWGRFDELRGADEGEPANQNSYLQTYYIWRDLNGNRMFDRGETNLDPNGPDFVRLLAGQAFTDTGAAGNMLVNPDERQPKLDEFTLALERELVSNLAIQVSSAYRRQFDVRRFLNTRRPYEAYNIPITNADPGPDGVLRTGDDPGTFLTYYDYPVALRGLAFQLPMYINDPKANRTWTTFQVAVGKRLAGGWSLNGSYSATKIDDPLVTNSGGGLDYNTNTVDPNSEINAATQTWEWLGKASGSYQFPYGILLAANFEHRSGDPYARTVLVRGGVTIPSLVLRAEPIGSLRTPNLNLLDYRIEKSFALSPGKRLSLRVDIFNTLNISSALTLQARVRGRLRAASDAWGPRQVQFGGAFTF